MKYLLISLVASLARSALIVDRQFCPKSFAEGIPLSVTYTFYNTFGG